MKYLIRFMSAGLTIVLIFSIGATHAADVENGFMGIPWRADLSALSDFVKIDERNGIQNYIRPSIIHTVGDIKISPVVYSCLANEFFAVYFEKDILIYSRLRNYYSQKYGPFTSTLQLNPRRTTDTWNHLDSKIKIEVNRETGKLKLSLYYTPLSSKVNEQRLEAYQENTRRFLDRINKDRAVEHLNLLR